VSASPATTARQERVKTRERRRWATQHGPVTLHASPGERVDLGVDPLGHLPTLGLRAVLAARLHP